MLPFYRYMVIWKDLYSVFGGFTTWAYEDLGIISFTNEMWNTDQYFPDKTEARKRAAARASTSSATSSTTTSCSAPAT